MESGMEQGGNPDRENFDEKSFSSLKSEQLRTGNGHRRSQEEIIEDRRWRRKRKKIKKRAGLMMESVEKRVIEEKKKARKDIKEELFMIEQRMEDRVRDEPPTNTGVFL